ncbi:MULTISPECIES: Fis family transcriptional regulator [unclassified Vibrio]|uniref:Fis family transcriptional regulator n=1 Tax=Vibrio sp. HB236076 TaxID=3232307 RepID=A0AB39HHA7_9VIBR|nr:Fis family transcriptional regulator [Vibrio sp. HB161653]MDP5254319.1 Fis family transcriptional regulator [Vibrio sp. HB161653]
MRKSDKKIDNQIREVLTTVCEQTLKEFQGFLWVTHSVDFNSFPQSLKIVCVFETNHDGEAFLDAGGEKKVSATIQAMFNQVGIKLKNAAKHIHYDTQENCERTHQGKWAVRLTTL